MPKIVKLNYDRKVRYLFDKDTEECERLSEQVMDHYGQFLETPHGWWMEDIKRFQKVLRECGLSVNEFLREEFVMPQKSVQKPKSKVRKSVVTKKKTPVKKKTPTKRKKVA
jgi:hypothetical protein